jgi:hypothetical protein
MMNKLTLWGKFNAIHTSVIDVGGGGIEQQRSTSGQLHHRC